MAKQKRKPRQPDDRSTSIYRSLVREAAAVAMEGRGWSVIEWAQHAGLASGTIYRLLNGITRFPQWETISKVCLSVNLALVSSTKTEVKLRVTNRRGAIVKLKKRGGRRAA